MNGKLVGPNADVERPGRIRRAIDAVRRAFSYQEPICEVVVTPPRINPAIYIPAGALSAFSMKPARGPQDPKNG